MLDHDRCGKLNRNLASWKILTRLLAAWLLLAWGEAAFAAGIDPPLAPVKAYLVGKGMPPAQAEALLSNSEVRFEEKLMARMLARPERKMDYRQFLRPEVIARARAYAHQHAAELQAAQRRSGVAPPVVVAILTVESGLGTYTGKWSAVGMLASQAVLDSPLARQRLAVAWPAKQRRYLSTPQANERFRRRAEWARAELWGLILVAKQRGVSPLVYKGSPAGALGMPQFMPTSLLKWGTDGDRDGVVDLTKHADAIHSVATYLAEHGWRPGLGRQGQAQVVHTYNHSQPYVDTVLDLAARIK